MKIMTLRATFAAAGRGRLPPYLGSTIRGLLGHCIRDLVCPTPDVKCHLCPISDDCAYAQNFSTPGHQAGAVNPYVLYVLTNGKVDWNEADICQFDITLIGRSSEQGGLIVDAFKEMGSRGWGVARIPFKLIKITDPVRHTLIWHLGKMWLRNLQPQPLCCEERFARAAVVHFETPVRVKEGQNLKYSLSFADLIQSLSRRLSLLSHAYTDHRLEWNESEMLSAAREIRTTDESWHENRFKRFSMNREGQHLYLPAIEGWARYEGNITPFTPLLAAGERLHIGKNTTHGFGRFHVDYDQ